MWKNIYRRLCFKSMTALLLSRGQNLIMTILACHDTMSYTSISNLKNGLFLWSSKLCFSVLHLVTYTELFTYVPLPTVSSVLLWCPVRFEITCHMLNCVHVVHAIICYSSNLPLHRWICDVSQSTHELSPRGAGFRPIIAYHRGRHHQ